MWPGRFAKETLAKFVPRSVRVPNRTLYHVQLPEWIISGITGFIHRPATVDGRVMIGITVVGPFVSRYVLIEDCQQAICLNRASARFPRIQLIRGINKPSQLLDHSWYRHRFIGLDQEVDCTCFRLHILPIVRTGQREALKMCSPTLIHVHTGYALGPLAKLSNPCRLPHAMRRQVSSFGPPYAPTRLPPGIEPR